MYDTPASVDVPRKPVRLILRDEVAAVFNADLIAYVGSADKAAASPGGGADRRLLAAQLYLLCGARREAIAALEALSRDGAAFAAASRYSLGSGDHLGVTFTVDGDGYRYFYGLYNHTWRNERAVEIPVARRFLDEHPGETLEIGNVLGHYFSHGHTVVDKYEKGEGIVGADIIDYAPPQAFDTIVSISTLEHIGKDHGRDDTKAVRVYEHITRTLLADTGTFLFTVPIGFNPIMDAHIDSERIRPDEHFCLERISADNDWIQIGWDEAKKCKYMSPFHCANAMYFGITYGKNHPLKR